jgi:C-terminal processing protease CtpA/Prc
LSRRSCAVTATLIADGQRFPLAIVRDKIDLTEQAASLRFETRERNGKPFKLAIIDLPSFYGDSDPGQRQCTDDVEALLKQVKEAKADGLLLDLSRNGGLLRRREISGFLHQGRSWVKAAPADGVLSDDGGSTGPMFTSRGVGIGNPGR